MTENICARDDLDDTHRPSLHAHSRILGTHRHAYVTSSYISTRVSVWPIYYIKVSPIICTIVAHVAQTSRAVGIAACKVIGSRCMGLCVRVSLERVEAIDPIERSGIPTFSNQSPALPNSDQAVQAGLVRQSCRLQLHNVVLAFIRGLDRWLIATAPCWAYF